MIFRYFQGELESANIDLRSAEKGLDKARKALEMFERNIRVNDPTHKNVWEAKNDTQRKLVLEHAYQAHPNEGKWYELKDDIDRCERAVRECQREYDYYRELSVRVTVAKVR